MELHLSESGAEAGEHLPHVASFLHADDTQMILLIHPNQEGLVVIMPVGQPYSERVNQRGSCQQPDVLDQIQSGLNQIFSYSGWE